MIMAILMASLLVQAGISVAVISGSEAVPIDQMPKAL